MKVNVTGSLQEQAKQFVELAIWTTFDKNQRKPITLIYYTHDNNGNPLGRLEVFGWDKETFVPNTNMKPIYYTVSNSLNPKDLDTFVLAFQNEMIDAIFINENNWDGDRG